MSTVLVLLDVVDSTIDQGERIESHSPALRYVKELPEVTVVNRSSESFSPIRKHRERVLSV